MPYIYSTLTASTNYTVREKLPSGISRVSKNIVIQGGANIANKHLLTPRGVVTNVSEKDLELLKTNSVFKRHLKSGFIKIQDNETKIEKVVSDMVKSDASAPLNEKKIKQKGVKKNNESE